MANKHSAILVVSFGTTHTDTLAKTIGAIEQAARDAYPQIDVMRAFTSGMVIRKLRERDGIRTQNVREALEDCASAGIADVYIQPTHMIRGTEYDELLDDARACRGKFSKVRVGEPLLSSTDDYFELVDELNAILPAPQPATAIVLMGHGTAHRANSAYPALDYALKDMGRGDVFVGTVEGYPALDSVLRHVSAYGAKKICLQPLMIVAGEHAANDMAGDAPGSWKSRFLNSGYAVECRVRGLGEYECIRAHFMRHIAAIMDD